MINLGNFARLLIVIATAGGSYLIYRAVGQFAFEDIVSSVLKIPGTRFVVSLAFAACSYVCLSMFDALALAYLRRPLPYPKIFLASFVSLSIGHTVGLAAFSSGALRYRFYSGWGLAPDEIAKLIVFCGATVALGLSTLAGIALMISSAAGAEMPIGSGAAPFIGALFLLPATAYLIVAARRPGDLRFRKWTLEIPSVKLALAQIGIGIVNFGCVAACLHQLLQAFGDASFWTVVHTYTLANMTAIASHVPGGLGVLETALAYLLTGSGAIGAFIAFRTIYFFIPLGFGLFLLLVSELLRMKRPRDLPSNSPGKPR